MNNILSATLITILLIPPISYSKEYLISAAYLPENVEKDGRSGRELEVVSNIFKCMGHTIKVDIQPYFRHIYSFKENNKFDALITLPKHESAQFFRTKSHISYHNGASYLENKNFSIDSISDLKDLHIISFKSAKSLHPELKDHIPHMASYQEAAEQLLHVKMLLKKRVDVVLGDGLIIKGLYNLLNKSNKYSSQKVRFKGILKPSPFYVAFRNQKDVSPFNHCLDKLKKSKTLQKINQKYLKKYQKTLDDEYIGLE